MSGGSAPAPPDMTPIAQASQDAAKLQYQTSADQLEWAKQQYADAKPVTDRINNSLLDTLDVNTANAAEDRARYQQLYQPVEDAYVKKAMTYDSPENMALLRGRAAAGVAQQFDAAGAAAQRALEGYGVDPSMTRGAALDLSTKLQKAAAIAGASNQSDLQTQQTADQMRAQAISVGRGYPAQTTAEYGTGINAGNSANQNQNSTYGAFAPALGNPTAWAGLGNQSIGTWGQTVNSMYSNQMEGYKANQSSSSGAGAALGMIGGMAMMMSDERLKEDITPVGKTKDGQTIYTFRFKGSPKTEMGLLAQEVEKKHPEAVATHPSGYKMVDYKGAIPHMARGGAIPMGGALPGRGQGGAIPVSASPSGGAMEDDVNIRAQPDEFIMPKDAVLWMGEKKLQDMISKAREEKQQAIARPVMKPPLPVRSQTQPQHMAIPVSG